MRRKEMAAPDAGGQKIEAAFQNSNDISTPQTRKSGRKVCYAVPRTSGQIKRFPTQLSEFDLARLYEERKGAWTCEHPDASPSEYEAAMRRICDEIGF